MTRGKHAELAANKRYAAAMEHIDRLTNQIAELKMRTKAVEAEAAQAAALRADRDRLRDDPVVAELVDKIGDALRQREVSWRRWQRAKPELGKLFEDVCESNFARAYIDKLEFINHRYPNLAAFLMGRDKPLPGHFHEKHARRLSDAAAVRLERVAGLRGEAAWARGRDMANVADEIADVVRMNLTPEEIEELLGLKEQAEL